MLRRLTLLAALAAPMVLAQAANAGTYDVYSCYAGLSDFHNPGANATAWTRRDDPGGQYQAFDQCGSTANGFGVISIGGYQAPANSYGEVSFAAAPGTKVERLRLWRDAWSNGSGTGGSAQRNYLFTLGDGNLQVRGDDFDGSDEVPEGRAGTSDTANNGLIPANLLDVDMTNLTPSTVSYRVGCGFSAGCPTGRSDGGFAAGVKIYGAIVTLRDPTDPDLSVAGGGLLDTSAPHSGTQTVHVSFAKDNSGIKRLAVFADDATSPVGVVDFERNKDKCQWWQARPCQDVSDVDVPVDTRRVSDGTHRFVVRAYDAAENARAFTSDPVTVKNGTDAKPDSFGTPVPVRGPLNGAGASDAARLTAAFAGRRRHVLRVRYSARATVTGRLLDEAGRPVTGAVVGIGALTGPGGAEQPVGTATTGRDGRFVFRVPARGPSRRLVVSYRSHLGDVAAVSTALLRLDVAAGVRLRVHPRHVRNGAAITFRGSLLGRPVPAAGKLVDMQVKIGRRWHTFATTRARGRRGSFAYRYRFTRTFERVTYTFRALARTDGAYPWATGASKAVRVKVN